MGIENYYALVGFILMAAGILLELSTIPKLIHEYRRPRDGFTQLRLYVLMRPIIYVVTTAPFLLRLSQIIFQEPRTLLASISTVSIPLGFMMLALFTYLSYTYKERL